MTVVSAHGKHNPYLVVYLNEGRVYVVTHRSVAQLVSYELDLAKHRMQFFFYLTYSSGFFWLITGKSVYSIFYMTNNILLLPYRVVHHCPYIPNHPGSPGSQNRRTARNEICTGLHRTVSVLGRDQGCTVKYSPLAEGVPQGEAQGNFRRQWVYVTIYPELSINIDAIHTYRHHIH